LRPWHERANPISNFFGCKTKYRHVEFDDKIGVDPFMNKYKVDLGTTSQWTTKDAPVAALGTDRHSTVYQFSL
jgi:hypothetical protein